MTCEQTANEEIDKMDIDNQLNGIFDWGASDGIYAVLAILVQKIGARR